MIFMIYTIYTIYTIYELFYLDHDLPDNGKESTPLSVTWSQA